MGLKGFVFLLFVLKGRGNLFIRKNIFGKGTSKPGKWAGSQFRCALFIRAIGKCAMAKIEKMVRNSSSSLSELPRNCSCELRPTIWAGYPINKILAETKEAEKEEKEWLDFLRVLSRPLALADNSGTNFSRSANLGRFRNIICSRQHPSPRLPRRDILFMLISGTREEEMFVSHSELEKKGGKFEIVQYKEYFCSVA